MRLHRDHGPDPYTAVPSPGDSANSVRGPRRTSPVGQLIRRSAARVARLVTLAAPLACTAAAGQSFPNGAVVRAQDGYTLRHNPIFGFGPQTIWRGGVGISLEAEARQASGTAEVQDRALHAELSYGATQDVTLTAALPLVRWRSVNALVPGASQLDRDATGVGDAVIRVKWRFFHLFKGSTQIHAAFIGGVKLPLASASSDPPLGTGSTDSFGGATISRDGLRYYLWASGLARVNGEAFGTKRGNEYRYDAAVGVRPWIPTFTGIDPLLLLEFNGVTASRNVVDGLAQAATGGTVLALSPGFWLTYKNWALQGAVKLPVYQNLRGDQPRFDYTAILKIETHM